MRHLVSLVVFIALGACTQGEGERCQVNSDCVSGLTCNVSTKTCLSGSTAVGVDAAIDAPWDAGDGDATVVDAAVDAPVDPTVDATVDAAPDA